MEYKYSKQNYRLWLGLVFVHVLTLLTAFVTVLFNSSGNHGVVQQTHSYIPKPSESKLFHKQDKEVSFPTVFDLNKNLGL